MEQWLEVTIRTASGGIDLLCAELTEAGFDSFVIDDSEQFRQFLDGARAYWDYVDEKLAARMRDLSQVRLYLPEETAEAQLAELRALLAELTGLSMPDAAHIEAMSGVTMARLACFARDNGLTGLEFAHGIPGTVGGGVYMNAGAYGGEIRAVCRWSQEMLPDGTLVRREGVSQGFGYRTSVFQHTDGVIVRACFALQPGDPGIIRETMRELMTRRTVSQPLDLPSAGSAFKRPQGGYAAALIESAGLKGLTVGGAQVSEKHAGFVVNRGGATAADVLELLRQVQQRVLEHSGIRLEPEIRLWD